MSTLRPQKGERRGFMEDWKLDVIASLGELLGTITFLLVGLGGIQAGIGASVNDVSGVGRLMYIATSMGLSLLFSAFIFFRVTGAAFNPQVSLALFLVGVINPLRFILYTIAQVVGAIIAAALLDGLLPGELTVTPALANGTSKAQGVFIEMFVTAALVLSVLFLAVEKSRVTFMAPAGIGLTLFACHLFAVNYTGCAQNSARAFGPAVISGFNGHHWIYWIGGYLGSLLASGIYVIFKAVKYWNLNPDADTHIHKKSPQIFDKPLSPTTSNSNGRSNEKTARTGDNIV